MRSTRSIPVSLSSSYLTDEPMGISITAVNSAGSPSPGVTSCHACIVRSFPAMSSPGARSAQTRFVKVWCRPDFQGTATTATRPGGFGERPGWRRWLQAASGKKFEGGGQVDQAPGFIDEKGHHQRPQGADSFL